MSRRLAAILLALPALVLIAWLVVAQLPRWTAPQSDWFAPDTPGVCAAVASLALYEASRTGDSGIGREGALTEAQSAFVEHYDSLALALSVPMPVQATLPGVPRAAYYLVTARLNDAALPTVAVVYLDAAEGTPRTLITATEDPAQNCSLDVRAALLAALRSPPLIGLAAYVAIALVGLVIWWLLKWRTRRTATVRPPSNL